jgi:SAM-dependent methyltransferase
MSLKENKIKFLELGKQPIANRFLHANELESEFFYTLDVVFDVDTCLVTHLTYVDPPMMFNENYTYRGSMSTTMRDHFTITSEYFKQKYNPKTVLEIGSNDGVFIKNWSSQSTYAVEPCANFANETNNMGYKTYPEFWTSDLSERIKNEIGKMDLIFAANCICHIPDLDQTFAAVYNLLSDDGVFIFEDPSLAQMINTNSYDQIYDEHPHIFSVIALKNLLERNGLTIVRVDNLNVHGGSNRIYAKKSMYCTDIDSSVYHNIEFEMILGLDKIDTFHKFARKVEQSKLELVELLNSCKRLGKKVISYGATSKSTTVFNYCGINSSLIDYVIDTTPEKIGKLTPGSHIPIRSSSGIESDVDVAYLGAWNFATEIMNKEKDYISRGGKFITHVPIVKFI